MIITKRFTFESAHFLPYHKGKCHQPHGHSFKLFVSLQGDVKPDNEKVADSGMVEDFAVVSARVKNLINERLDHKSLNAIMVNPTAENMAVWIWNQLIEDFGDLLYSVVLYETEDSCAEISR